MRKYVLKRRCDKIKGKTERKSNCLKNRYIYLYFAVKYALNVNFLKNYVKNFYVLKQVNDKKRIDNGGFLCYTFLRI